MIFNVFIISSLILMPVMDIRHMSMLVLGARMLMHMGMRLSCHLVHLFVTMKLVSPGVPVLMHDRHMDMEMSMLLIRQQPGAHDHQDCRSDK